MSGPSQCGPGTTRMRSSPRQSQDKPEHWAARAAELKAKLMAGQRPLTTSPTPEMEVDSKAASSKPASPVSPWATATAPTTAHAATRNYMALTTNEKDDQDHEKKRKSDQIMTDDAATAQSVTAAEGDKLALASDTSFAPGHASSTLAKSSADDSENKQAISEGMEKSVKSETRDSKKEGSPFDDSTEDVALGQSIQDGNSAQSCEDESADHIRGNTAQKEVQAIVERVQNGVCHREKSLQGLKDAVKAKTGLPANHVGEHEETTITRQSVQKDETNETRLPDASQNKMAHCIRSSRASPQNAPTPPPTATLEVPKQSSQVKLVLKSTAPASKDEALSMSTNGHIPTSRLPTYLDPRRVVTNGPFWWDRKGDRHESRPSAMPPIPVASTPGSPSDSYRCLPGAEYRLNQPLPHNRDLKDWLNFTGWNDATYRASYLQRQRRLAELEQERQELLSVEEHEIKAKAARSRSGLLPGAEKLEGSYASTSRRAFGGGEEASTNHIITCGAPPAVKKPGIGYAVRNAGKELFDSPLPSRKRRFIGKHEVDLPRKMYRTNAGGFRLGSHEDTGYVRVKRPPSRIEKGEISSRMDTHSYRSRSASPSTYHAARGLKLPERGDHYSGTGRSLFHSSTLEYDDGPFSAARLENHRSPPARGGRSGRGGRRGYRHYA